MEEEVGELKDKVGTINFDDEDCEVFEIQEGFAAVLKQEKEYVPGIRWIVNACGGNINRRVAADDEEEARERLIEICESWKTVGVLYRWNPDGSTDKVTTYGAKSRPK